MPRIAALLLLAPLILSGCAANSTNVKPAPTPAPTTAPTSSATPEPSRDGTALTAESSYLLCIDKNAESEAEAFGGSRDQISNASYADSWVVDRGDGSFFIWSDEENYMVPADLISAAATTCVVGGTLEHPTWFRYGGALRDLKDGTDPYAVDAGGGHD